MKTTINLLRYAPKKALAVIVTAVIAVIVPAMLFAWGPSNRPTYTMQSPADHVTFNSITNNPDIGDERNFVRVRDAVPANGQYTEQVSLVAGHEYLVYVSYHNNASSSLNAGGTGIAHGVYVKAQVPSKVNQNGSSDVTGTIGANNASPAEVWDEATFNNTTSSDISLSFVPGSAIIHNNGTANGSVLSNNIVTTGATLGHNALDGNISGCEQFSGFVTFRVKAEQPNFNVVKQARLSGASTWANSVNAKNGDVVEFLVSYTNTGTQTQSNVSVTDNLPTGVTYINGSTSIKNASHPNYTTVSDNIITNLGLNIGSYTPGSNAYVKFSARVATNSNALRCGVNSLQNVATVVTDDGSKSASVPVNVTKTCQDIPKEYPKTGAGENIAAFIGLGVLVSAFSYYRASRRLAVKR